MATGCPWYKENTWMWQFAQWMHHEVRGRVKIVRSKNEWILSSPWTERCISENGTPLGICYTLPYECQYLYYFLEFWQFATRSKGSGFIPKNIRAHFAKQRHNGSCHPAHAAKCYKYFIFENCIRCDRVYWFKIPIDLLHSCTGKII